jgi:CO/xanthine dehydrogenase FAD-binding subunit
VKDFDYLEPNTLEEACSILASYGPRGKVIAGGTDLLVQIKQKKIAPVCLVTLKRITALNGIVSEGKGLRIGALTLLGTLEENPFVQEKYGSLAKAAGKIGSVQIRNLGTIGGNLCNASPSADMAPPLMALGAKLELFSQQGMRSIPIEEFFRGPFQTVLGEGEVLKAISIENLPRRSGCSYKWIPKITEEDESLVGVGVFVVLKPGEPVIEELRIALGSLGPRPLRATQTEEMLRGNVADPRRFKEAGEIAAGEVAPRSRAGYRMEMTKVLVEDALKEAVSKAIVD